MSRQSKDKEKYIYENNDLTMHTNCTSLSLRLRKWERKTLLSDEKIPQVSTTQIQYFMKTEKDQNEAIKKKLAKQAAKPQ